MHERDDHALLRDYADNGSEAAFAALVARHVNKVYSVALRHTGKPHQAEEITQAVFVILARKAGRLGGRVILEGWLYQAARLTAVTYIRGEIRRARREQEAHMHTALNQTEAEVWTQIAPLLDNALAGLNETDRQAVVLRFFYGQSMKEVGATMGGSEGAARLRVHRALEKLRRFFSRRGITSTPAILAGAISAHSVQVAPAALAQSVTVVALAKGAAAGSSTPTLIEGALKLMAWTKIKSAVIAGAVLLLAAGTTTVVVRHSHPAAPTIPAAAPDEQSRFEAETGRRINQSKVSAMDCYLFAKAHQNQWPTDFAQLKAWKPEIALADSDWEFVSGGSLHGFAQPERTILFREKKSRRSPDGKYVRLYVLADGSVQTETSANDDFAAVEKQRGYLVHKAGGL
jgi:RNA polymerase sigma factor (sigma-70 family)